jgi:hypothetical protein
MNANELDKWIDNSPYTEKEEVIRLLRQLQAENEALRKTVDSLFAGLESTTALAKAQAERKT